MLPRQLDDLPPSDEGPSTGREILGLSVWSGAEPTFLGIASFFVSEIRRIGPEAALETTLVYLDPLLHSMRAEIRAEPLKAVDPEPVESGVSLAVEVWRGALATARSQPRSTPSDLRLFFEVSRIAVLALRERLEAVGLDTAPLHNIVRQFDAILERADE